MTMNDSLEDICYEAYKLGIKEELFKEANKIRKQNPYMETLDIYEQAFGNIRKKTLKGNQK